MQVVPPPQTFPHAPQLVGEVVRSAQAPPHLTVPIPQVSTQRPLLHTLLGGQAMPHAPQLAGSDSTVTQALPHGTVPTTQIQLPLQNCVGAQARSHEPQWSREICRFSQVPLQKVCPAAQVVERHWPEKQLWPLGQACPHPPQWRGSAWVSMHWPLQLLCPLGHWQLPETHEVPPEQTLPQLPQFELSVCGSTHLPPHASFPASHWQAPITQLAFAPH